VQTAACALKMGREPAAERQRVEDFVEFSLNRKALARRLLTLGVHLEPLEGKHEDCW